ncbi:MAG: isoleucine--tRNA ligase [Flammeovirgaceae bacterium]|nr:isoleucine--tRNA ligase [Flammeovirgaceae bacterium]
MKYKEYKKLDLVNVGNEILKFWEDNQIFEKSISSKEGNSNFTFYEGPPSANGMPGIHHVIARTIKDIFCRYKTLKGYQVKRKGGWDTHGLPVELKVEKDLGITKEDIGVKISVEEYNQKCREAVMKFKGVWDDLTKKIGYWVDLDNPYITFEKEYIETLWHLLKKLYDKGLLYKGYTIQPFSPAAGTGLSSHELNQPGTYRDVKDTSITAQFKVKKDEKSQWLFEGLSKDNLFILAWTTTPWTLPSNSALAIGENIEYVRVSTFNQYTFKPVTVVLAKDLVGKYFSAKQKEAVFEDYKPGDKVVPFKVLSSFKGKKLVGVNYEQLLPYVQPEGEAFKVIPGDFVSTADGTGIVHIAPTFGADDARVAQQAGIAAILVKDENGKDMPLVDRQGRFVKEVTDFPLHYVKAEYEEDETVAKSDYKPTDVLIAIKLKEENRAFKVEKYEHSYPHCWRTDKPVLYYPLDSWFIKTTAMKDQLIAANKTINWKPEATGTGRFGNWLENLVDWNLSRSRYWGTPLPIWRATNDNSAPDICIGSIIDDFKGDEWLYFGGEKYEKFLNDLKNETGEYKIFREKLEQENKINKQPESSPLPDGIQIDIEKLFSEIKEKYFSFEDWEKFEVPFKTYFDYLTTVEKELDSIDLHRPYVDRIIKVVNLDTSNRDAGLGADLKYYKREEDLIDVWFDSGAMPYAQWHYPFENKDIFEQSFPADFISEGVDQTRGWFFTLHALAVMLEFPQSPVSFKNVVSTGLVLDEKGEKMSKRKGNVIDPFDTLATYGPDATRWYMIENAPPWDNLKFSLSGIQEVQRKFFGTLYNTYSFFALYSNLDNFTFKEAEIPMSERTEGDQWIISKLNSLIVDVDKALGDYEPTKAARAIQNFTVDDLSNWYVRQNRKRFWKGEYNKDKMAAYQTLYTCLETISKLMSPISPFFAERLFKDLNEVSGKESVESVHLSDFPKADESVINTDLEEKMALAQEICSLVHSIRKKNNLKVRQPLNSILIPVESKRQMELIKQVEDIILNEVNIKNIDYQDGFNQNFVRQIKPNFREIGKHLDRKLIQPVAKFLSNISNLNLTGNLSDLDLLIDEIRNSSTKSTFRVIQDEKVEIRDDFYEMSYTMAKALGDFYLGNSEKLALALDINITDELKEEGIARDIVNKIQNLRKDMGLEVQDKIIIKAEKGDAMVNTALTTFKDYICTETQALALSIEENVSDATELELDDFKVRLSVAKS